MASQMLSHHLRWREGPLRSRPNAPVPDAFVSQAFACLNGLLCPFGQAQPNTTREQEVKSEIAKFKALPLLHFKNRNRKFNDPLMWWKEHQHQFPLLVQLVRRFLCLQSTSAASERIFSKAERIIRDRRGGLDPDNAGKNSQFVTVRDHPEQIPVPPA